jgi:hypothetical protein
MGVQSSSSLSGHLMSSIVPVPSLSFSNCATRLDINCQFVSMDPQTFVMFSGPLKGSFLLPTIRDC